MKTLLHLYKSYFVVNVTLRVHFDLLHRRLLWVSSDEHNSRFHEAKKSELERNSTFTPSPRYATGSDSETPALSIIDRERDESLSLYSVPDHESEGLAGELTRIRTGTRTSSDGAPTTHFVVVIVRPSSDARDSSAAGGGRQRLID
ncbi:hypothetical protein J6590_077415 [Homalodisca vitripennis]|nr:hypothetical protein J6590_077415 [Homalodisca vitripennis]